MILRDHLPPITKRVITAVVVMAIGMVTNELHKNVVSGLAISISAIALAVWLGMELSKPPRTRQDQPKDEPPTLPPEE